MSLLCVFYPRLFGEGHDTIKSFTNGDIQKVINNSFCRYISDREWVVILFVGVICLLKAFATSITIQSGGNGGNFAPSLFAGGALGYVFALVCNNVELSSDISAFIKPLTCTALESDSVVELARKFDESGLWHPPVIDTAGKFVGFVSKSKVLDQHRKLLQKHSG